MRKIWNKGHRIRASDKHLVYHFSIGTLLFVFVAVMGYIAKEINRVISVCHLKAHILSVQYTDDFRERILKR